MVGRAASSERVRAEKKGAYANVVDDPRLLGLVKERVGPAGDLQRLLERHGLRTLR